MVSTPTFVGLACSFPMEASIASGRFRYQAGRGEGAIDIEQADGVGVLSVGEVGSGGSVSHHGGI